MARCAVALTVNTCGPTAWACWIIPAPQSVEQQHPLAGLQGRCPAPFRAASTSTVRSTRGELIQAARTAASAPPGISRRRLCEVGPRQADHLRMFTARLATRTRVSSEVRAWKAISPLARRVSGRVSVGLKAAALVQATKR